ncbi:MAG: stage 0 sporulation family protein [Ruminiclostridium sp.]|nr:stage 0 sporulation family protein [Ruminiclostridium sp.]
MTEIIGIRFKEVGKVYFFSPGKKKLSAGEKVIVETARGVECGEVVIPNRMVEDDRVVQPLKTIMRTVTDADLRTLEENKKKEQEIMKVFVKKIEEHKLSMKAIDVEYTFDGSKILFYFTAENRVDFREIVKDLAGIYRTRIELRQIGVRDEAKMLGGLGICGRPFCCSSFLGEFQPVSIKMAKEQSLSLNPTKISGTCGRLMCCLKYEQDCYEELLKITPKIDAYVETAEGKGVVVETNILTGVIKVRLDKKQDAPPITVKRDEVKVLKDAKIRVNRDEIAALKELED